MALSFAHATKLIGVPQIDAQPLTLQVLINAIRTEEATERGIVEPQIADASGKDDLGGGVSVGITVALRSTWKLDFAAGTYQATVDGGNLSDALDRINNTGSPQVLVLASAAATIVNSTGETPPTAAAIASAVLAAAALDPIASNVKEVADTAVTGSGTEGDPWGP
jgi:hypothetical protein